MRLRMDGLAHGGLEGEYETCQALLESPRFFAANFRDAFENISALDRAAFGGHHRVCGLLLSSHKFIAVAGDADGRIAFHHAVYAHEDVSGEDRLETCRVLLADGSFDVNATDRHGRRALDCALTGRYYDVCRCFLSHPRIDVARKAGERNPLFELLKAAVASETPDLETAQLVIEDERLSVAELNSSDPDTGRTILHDCCDDEAVCQVLLQSILFVATNDADVMGQTALHTAAKKSHLQTCAALLADPKFSAIEAKDDDGMTAEGVATPDAKIVFQAHQRLST